MVMYLELSSCDSKISGFIVKTLESYEEWVLNQQRKTGRDALLQTDSPGEVQMAIGKEKGSFQVRRMQLATSFTAAKRHQEGDPRDKSVSTRGAGGIREVIYFKM